MPIFPGGYCGPRHEGFVKVRGLSLEEIHSLATEQLKPMDGHTIEVFKWSLHEGGDLMEFIIIYRPHDKPLKRSFTDADGNYLPPSYWESKDPFTEWHYSSPAQRDAMFGEGHGINPKKPEWIK